VAALAFFHPRGMACMHRLMYALPMVSMEAVSLRITSGFMPRAIRYSAIAVDSCSTNPP